MFWCMPTSWRQSILEFKHYSWLSKLAVSAMTKALVLIGILWISSIICLVRSDEDQESSTNIKSQRAAVKAWAEFLSPEKDYDPTYWAETFKWQPANFFEHYASELSNIFKEKGAKVNFALVGACDGTNDRTIRDRFLPNEHWRGVFVEPFAMNYKDLSNFMETHKVSHRAHLIHAAATSKCNSTTIKMKRPTFEEKNSSLPHWMRRQIGAVVPFTKLNNKMTGGWVAEFTRCVSGPEILTDWTDALNHQAYPNTEAEGGADTEQVKQDDEVEGGKRKKKGKRKGGMIKKLRPHVLKVDVEGHDYDVLMGFLGEEMTQSMLPLMINFEAKSISKQFPALKETMEKRGYVVSHFATDGFALLRADAINKKPSKRSSTSTTSTTTGTATDPAAAADTESNMNNYNTNRPPPDTALEAAAEAEVESALAAGNGAQDDQSPPLRNIPEVEGQFMPELLSRLEVAETAEGANSGNGREGKRGNKRKGGKKGGRGGKGGKGKGGKGKRNRGQDDEVAAEN